MPNRVIKETACSSETLEKLTDLEERVFWRLIVNCDDFGCMDARLPFLRSRLFTLRTVEQIPDSVLKAAIKRLQEVGLIRGYHVDGKPYMYVIHWYDHQTQRATKPKYPLPEFHPKYAELSVDKAKTNKHAASSASKCKQVKSDESNGKQMSPYSYSNSYSNIYMSDESDRSGYSEEFQEFWKSYPSRPFNPKKRAYNAWNALQRLPKKDRPSPADLIAAVKRYAQYCTTECKDPSTIMHASTFLSSRDRRFEEWMGEVRGEVGKAQASEDSGMPRKLGMLDRYPGLANIPPGKDREAMYAELERERLAQEGNHD